MNKKHSGSDSQNNGQHTSETGFTDPVALGQILFEVFQKAQLLSADFLEKHDFKPADMASDPLNLLPTWTAFFSNLMSHPEKLAEMQMRFWQDWFGLWQDTAKKFIGGGDSDLYHPEKGDKRFRSPMWQESAFFDFIAFYRAGHLNGATK